MPHGKGTYGSKVGRPRKKYNQGTFDYNPNIEKDSLLLEELVKNFPLYKIVAEGRYWERDQVKKAFDLGAYNVVVGTAITRPHLITKRLMEAYNE